MRTSRLGAAMLLVAAILLTWSAPAFAQAGASTPVDRRPILLFGGGYDATTRWTGGFGVVVPVLKPWASSDIGVRFERGVEIAASAGAGGARLAIGAARVGRVPRSPVLFGRDLLMSVVRTGHSPREASADSTYVGLDGGITIYLMRLSAGVAHRAAGASGSHATIFSWSIGVQAGW